MYIQEAHTLRNLVFFLRGEYSSNSKISNGLAIKTVILNLYLEMISGSDSKPTARSLDTGLECS